MDQRWVRLSRGVHRLDDKLLIILDVDAVLALDAEARAAEYWERTPVTMKIARCRR